MNGIAISTGATAGAASGTTAVQSASGTTGAQSGTVVTVVLVIVGLLGLLLLILGLIRCHSIREKRRTTDVETGAKISDFLVGAPNTTPRISSTIELDPYKGNETARPPPSYFDVTSAPGTPALTYYPSPHASRCVSPALLNPPSPVLQAQTPASPQPAATSPLLSPRHF